jgi:hypothetical protein
VFRATGGGFSWTYDMGDGQSCHITADSSHPLTFKNLPHIYYVKGKAPSGYAMLIFESAPTAISVDIYDIKSEKLVKTVTVTDGILELLKGDYLYDIKATWRSRRDYSGEAHYCFQTTEN